MRDKRAWIFVAFLVNLALLPMVVGVPRGQAQERGDRMVFPCCKKATSGKRYCCRKCCVLVWNCMSHRNCETQQQQ